MTATKRAKIERRIRQLENDLTVLHDEFYGEGLIACAETVGSVHQQLQSVKGNMEKGNFRDGSARN